MYGTVNNNREIIFEVAWSKILFPGGEGAEMLCALCFACHSMRAMPCALCYARHAMLCYFAGETSAIWPPKINVYIINLVVIYGSPPVNLFEFTFLMVYYSKVLTYSANERQ